jgi:hypothetical protein
MGLTGKSVPANKVPPITHTRVPSGATSFFAGGSLWPKPVPPSASIKKGSSRQNDSFSSGRPSNTSTEQRSSNGTDEQWDEYYGGTNPLTGSVSTTSNEDIDISQSSAQPPEASMSTHTELFGMTPKYIQDFLNSVVSPENRSVRVHIEAPESWKSGHLQTQDLYHLLAFLIWSYPMSYSGDNPARTEARTNLTVRADEAKSRYLELAQLKHGEEFMDAVRHTVWWAGQITYEEIRTDQGLLQK